MIQQILIEGIDCSGKTTLAKELKTRCGWDICSLSHRKTEQFSRYLREYTREATIFDRGHISEQIFGRRFRSEESLSERQLRILDAVLSETALIIFADPLISDAKRRYREREGATQYTKIEELAALHGEFRDWFACHDYGDRVIHYESRNFSELDELVSLIKPKLKTSELR